MKGYSELKWEVETLKYENKRFNNAMIELVQANDILNH